MVLTPERVCQLVQLAQVGDRSAWDELIRVYRPYMLIVALKITCGDHAAAEDAVQSACLRAITKIETFRSEGSIKGWLAQIAVHQALYNYRKHRRFPAVSVPDNLESPRATPEVLAVIRNQLEMVNLLDKLHDGVDLEMLLDRAAGVPLRDMVGRYHGVDSLPAVKSRLHRTRNTLGKIIDFLPGED